MEGRSFNGDTCCSDRCLRGDFISLCKDSLSLPVVSVAQEVRRNLLNGAQIATTVFGFRYTSVLIFFYFYGLK